AQYSAAGLLFNELLQRQLHRLAALSTAGDGFGEFHVVDAGGEIGERDGFAFEDGLYELGLDAPVAGFIGGDGDFLRFFIVAGVALPSAKSGNAIVGQVIVQNAFGAVQMDAHVLTERRHAAEVINGPRAALQHGEGLYAVGSADLAANAAFRIDARGN